MRGESWLRVAFWFAWCTVIGWPWWVVCMTVGAHEARTGAALHDWFDLTVTTLFWMSGVTLVALAMALPAARWIASTLPRTRAILLTCVGLGILLPPWASWYVWWSSAPPGTIVFDLLAGWGDVGIWRRVILAVALVAWVWPVAVWCLVPAAMRWSVRQEEILQLDGAVASRIWWSRLRVEFWGLAMAALICGALVAGSTTAFDLAGVFTLANDLRVQSDLGSSSAALVQAAWPLMLFAIVGAISIWKWMGNRIEDLPRSSPVCKGTVIGSVGLWIACVAAPLAMLGFLRWRMGLGDLSIPGASLLGLMGRACIIAALTFLLCAVSAGMRWGWISSMLAIIWIAAALLPAPLTAAVVAEAWNGIAGNRVSTSGVSWCLGLLVRGGAIGLLAGRWVQRTQSQTLHDLARHDGVSWWQLNPLTISAGVAAGSVAAVLVSSELALTARLAPPMSEPPLAVTLLNAMHYQRGDAVVGLLVWLPVPVLILGSLMLIPLLRRARVMEAGSKLVVLLLAVHLIACDREDNSPAESTPPIIVEESWGLPGLSPGRFDRPRAIAVGPSSSWVVDKTGRVQQLVDGESIGGWTMPATANGMPVGVSVTPEGLIAVADTHEYRVAVFSKDGMLQHTFGTYGTSPGEFIYPTDVAFDSHGHWFVSEYGGHDRIQVFDEDGNVVRSLGGPGSAPGQFRRPQSMAFSPDGKTLWVADSGNHRIQGLDPVTGNVVRVIEGASLRYPYGIDVLPDGSVVVADYGAHTLSRWSDDGTLCGTWGGWGSSEGRLKMPWGIAYDPDRHKVLILDTGNARVHVVDAAALGCPMPASRIRP
ncbi:MAG: hypothetical protein MK100_08500 [Phycisphaerales bacterium]|nr:hypothetical protein [Phycisphaerales bacterium]